MLGGKDSSLEKVVWGRRPGREVGPIAALSSGTMGQCWDLPSAAAGKPLPAAKQPPRFLHPGAEATSLQCTKCKYHIPRRSELLYAGMPSAHPALPCPAPGPPSNPPRQRRDREIQSRLPWRCQYRAPLMFQQLHEHLHMLSGHPKAAGEPRFGLSSSPHHLTICGLHDWANHNVVRKESSALGATILTLGSHRKGPASQPAPPSNPPLLSQATAHEGSACQQ